MASRLVRVRSVHFAAGLVAALVLACTLGTLVAVSGMADGWARLSPADYAAIRFTVLQAAASALISVALAVPAARALARRRFPGRSTLVTLLGVPFILPVIVAVSGLLAVFGRNGLFNALLEGIGLPPVSIYGQHGVVFAHVFLNLPLAVRLILQGWLAIPAERFRLAASLGMGPREIMRWIEVPMLREVVPGALLLVFLICMTSFAVALTLGGGPSATTIELATYQAFRFDFDLGHAALLASVQFAITAAAALVALSVTRASRFGSGLDRVVERWDCDRFAVLLVDIGTILLVSAFLLVPLGMIVASGFLGVADALETVLPAVARSLAVAAASTLLALAAALPLALAVADRRGRNLTRRVLEATGYLSVAASPLVLGTGLFILFYPVVDPARLALPVTAFVNALMSLPFVLRILIPAAAATEAEYGRLADSLGMLGSARLRWLLVPRLRASLGFAAGLTAALSLGDLGVIALFADPQAATLPLEIHRLMQGYRMTEAAGASLLLLSLALAAFWSLDRVGRTNAST